MSPVVGLHRTVEAVHLVSHQTRMHAVLAFHPLHDDRVATTAVDVTPARMRWVHDSGSVTAAYESVDVLRVRGEGLGLLLEAADGQLTPFTGTYLFQDPRDGAVVLTSYETGRRYRVTCLSGRMDIAGDQALGTADRGLTLSGDTWEIAVEEYKTARSPYRARTDFDTVVAATAATFDAFVVAIAPWAKNGDAKSANLASYVVWSAMVAPRGYLHRESVLMSKHWMDKVWSWDHCFNGLALAPGLPELALDQFLIPFDHQDDSGALPDSVAHSEKLYNFVKPPIHGWAFERMRQSLAVELPDGALADAFMRLARWTDFWLDHRRTPGRALPHYQHGNDSGWDNATTFDGGGVVESPDLAAFLVVQLDVLAKLAEEIGEPAVASRYAAEADRVLEALIAELWDGSGFVVRHAISGQLRRCSSLLNTLPILLGERLPTKIRTQLAATISLHLTQFGPATERPDSPHYEADGYWRGPIWAPTTVLIEDGLRRSGFTGLADDINARFRRLCAHGGFAENFDALTGAGLRDRAYTWTASAYLLFAADSVG